MPCEITDNLDKRIYGKFWYDLSYDKEKDIFICGCKRNAAFNMQCEHIKTFKKLIDDLNGSDTDTE